MITNLYDEVKPVRWSYYFNWEFFTQTSCVWFAMCTVESLTTTYDATNLTLHIAVVTSMTEICLKTEVIHRMFFHIWRWGWLAKSWRFVSRQLIDPHVPLESYALRARSSVIFPACTVTCTSTFGSNEIELHQPQFNKNKAGGQISSEAKSRKLQYHAFK